MTCSCLLGKITNQIWAVARFRSLRFQKKSHWNVLFTAIFVFRMPLAFCANAVTVVFSSLVVESWQRRKQRKHLDCERAIIVETTNKEQQKYFFHEKGLGWGTCPRYLLRPAVQNGGQNSISVAHFSILHTFQYGKTVYYNRSRKRSPRRRRQQSFVLKRAM